MVISDINLLCAEQKNKLKIKISNANIKIYNRNNHKYHLIYKDKYIDVQNVNGIWYQLEPIERLHGDYNHEFLDLFVESDKYKIVFANACFKQHLLYFIRKMLDYSPVKTTYFFADLQGNNTMQYNITYNDFLNLIESDDLYFNVIYKIIKIN